VRNEVLQSVKDDRNILCVIKRKQANWIGHCLVRHVIEVKAEGKKEMTGRRGRRYKQLLEELK
jgi:hypothetical protein